MPQEGESLVTEGQLVVSHNTKVEEVRSQLGDFDYEMPPPGVKEDLEERPGFKDKKGGTYYGQWIKGTQIREGKGIYITHDRKLSEGWFMNNKLNGRSRFINTNGNYYIGEWVDSKIQGYGLHFNSTAGTTIEGQWENNKVNGFARATYKTGIIFEGDFENNIKVRGVQTWPNSKKRYEGQFLKNKIHGEGIYTTE